MEGTRVITLEPAVQGIAEASFEEAFGEYSELRGRMRSRTQARRQERRMKKIANKRQRKLAKQEIRLEKKRRRRAMKDEGEAMEPESESPVDMSLPTEDPRSENSYTDPSYQGGDEGYGEESTEPLGDSGEYEDEESSFDAETNGVTSSFDNETHSMVTGDAQAISRHKKSISFFRAKIAALEAKLKAGKLPSNHVANYGRQLRASKEALVKHEAALARLLRMMPVRPRLTKVQSKLNPSIEPNRIEIPAGSAEETSSFDAKESFKKHRNAIIGVAAAGLVIFALHKMKVFK